MYPSAIVPKVCDACIFRVPLQRCDSVFFYLRKESDLLKYKFINSFEIIEYIKHYCFFATFQRFALLSSRE